MLFKASQEHFYMLESVSICWKVVLQAFDLIGIGLSRKVGDGYVVWVGVDPWVGYK